MFKCTHSIAKLGRIGGGKSANDKCNGNILTKLELRIFRTCWRRILEENGLWTNGHSFFSTAPSAELFVETHKLWELLAPELAHVRAK